MTESEAVATSSAPGPGPATTVDLAKVGEHRFKAINARGGVVTLGHGDDPDFTPVELLLAALAGCGALDIDFITGKRAPFATFAARAQGTKVRDSGGNHLVASRSPSTSPSPPARAATPPARSCRAPSSAVRTGCARSGAR